MISTDSNTASTTPSDFPASSSICLSLVKSSFSESESSERSSPFSSNSYCLSPKKQLIQKQLYLLLHAQECDSGENCVLRNCFMMKKTIEHISECTSGNNCETPHCESSKKILFHFNNCSRKTCLCNPVRKICFDAFEGARDPDRINLIFQQLVLILHAENCKNRDVQNEKVECSVRDCSFMKLLLAHTEKCIAGKDCKIPHCISTRQIIAHWNSCFKPNCPICHQLKECNLSINSSPTPSNSSI